MLNLLQRAMQVFGVLAMAAITSSGAFAQKVVVAHRGSSTFQALQFIASRYM